MGLVVEGMLQLEEMLVLRLGTNNKRRVVAKLFDQADKIAALAKKMAPVDTHGVEQAIKVRPERGAGGGRERNGAGQFVRTEVEVYVDGSMANRDGVPVGQYAYYAHELIEPAGPNKLGPASLAKQASQGVQVGGGFLDRAVFVIEPGIEIDLLEAFSDV